jgi:tetratricopeptide (TPR) repeat protein
MSISSRWGISNPVICCAALCLVLWTGCTPPGPKALLTGERLIHEGKYEEAIAKLKVATELLPTNAQAWNHLGLAYHGAGQVDNAVHAYQTALSLNRNLAATRFNLGCLFLEQNNPTAAVSELSSYTVFNPVSAEGWGKLGLAQLQLNQLNPAEQSFKQALKLESRFPSALNGLGLIQLRRNRTTDAMQYFGMALRQQTNYGPAILNEAIVYQQYLKNRPVALQKYREYLLVNPGAPDAQAVRDMVHVLEVELGPAYAPVVTNPPPLLATVVTQAMAHAIAPSNATTTHAALTNAKAIVTAPAISAPVIQKVQIPVETEAAVKTNAPPTPITVAVAEPPKAKPVIAAPKIAPTTLAPKPAAPSKPVEAPAKVAEAPIVAEKVLNTVPVATPPPAPVLTTPVVEPTPIAPMTVVTQSITVASAPLAEPQTINTAVPVLNAPVPAKTMEFPSAQKPPKKSLIQKINPVNWLSSSAKTPKTPKNGKIVTPLAASNRVKSSTPGETLVIPSTPNSSQTASATAPQTTSRIARYPFVSPPLPQAGDRSAAEQAWREGSQAHTLGHWPDTLSAYRKAAQADPSFFAARYNLALALFHEQALSQALLEFETALVIDPSSFNARYNFALALQEANYPLDAANEFNKLVALAPADNRLHLALGNLYARQLFQPQMARKEYLRLLELEPGHPQAPAIRQWLAENP